MIGPEHRPEVGDAGAALGDALLVEIVAEDIDAVGSGQVVEVIAVEVADLDAAAGLEKAAAAQMLADEPAELEGDAIVAGELQVGNILRSFGRECRRLREACVINLGQREESCLAARGDFLRRAIAAEESVLVVFVKRDQLRHALGHPGMTGQRAVLGPRQFETALDARQRCRQGADAGKVKGQAGVH